MIGVDSLVAGFKGNAYTVIVLIIDKNHKFLACSPDGLVNENGEMGVIEIKNILQKKNMSFIQATKKVSNFCLQYTDEKVQLKKKHNYYFQCQGLLNISGLPWLDFIARSTSPYQIHIERIYRDEVLWNDTMLPKLEAFYFLALLPELAAPRYNKSPGIREPGDWFLVNTSKKKTSTRNRRNPRKIAVAKKKTTIRKDTDNSTTNKNQSSKNASNSKTTIKPSTSTTEQYTGKRKKSLSLYKVAAAKDNISECIDLVQERQQLIKLEDSSEFGWLVVQKYITNPIADNSENEKRMNRAQI
ncbi:unnamed protein product [Mytilus edulis]|uniref:YqaJ viral recombinase domain-containing protein n=1 Tax=Mytilus edulis TaxID=6550 RepID=A0A8S3V5I9_MYTED|nr:unnamed protein product [Mytilus edulis]